MLGRALREFNDDHCQQMAAAISYHVLFALFPLAIVGVGIVGLVTQGSSAAQSDVINAVLRLVPLSDPGKRQLAGLIDQVHGTAGALGFLGLAGVLWSATGLMATVRTALNTAWDVGRRHSFIAGKVVDLLLLAAALLVIAASLGITFVTTLVRHSSADLPTGLRGLAPLTGAVTAAGALLAAAALLFATFLMLYRFVSGASTRMHDVWPGAVIAAVGFEALQYGFSVYVSNFSHYNRVYGSLGAVVAFLFFVYLASWVFLFGAEVASEYPRMPPVKTTPEDAIGLPAPGQARTPPDGTGLSGPAGRARGMGAASGGGRAPSQVLNDASKPPFVGYRGP